MHYFVPSWLGRAVYLGTAAKANTVKMLKALVETFMMVFGLILNSVASFVFVWIVRSFTTAVICIWNPLTYVSKFYSAYVFLLKIKLINTYVCISIQKSKLPSAYVQMETSRK